MQAKFLLQREVKNFLDYHRTKSPSFELHFHSQIEIYLILEGSVEVIVNNHKRILKKGELSVALSYDTHGYKTVESSEVFFLSIPTSWCGDFLTVAANKQMKYPFIDDPETYQTIRDSIEKLFSAPNDIVKKGCVYVILGAILEKMSSEQREENHEAPFSADILIYISEHFKEELNLAVLSANFGYNPSYLSRSFRQTFGIPFARYLSMLRLREAILLLHEGKMSITECAFESGFGSMRSFYRAFHEEFGCTPKEYLYGEEKKKHKLDAPNR